MRDIIENYNTPILATPVYWLSMSGILRVFFDQIEMKRVTFIRKQKKHNTMPENIILKKSPKIEFQFRDNGFQLIDEQTEQNSGFYAYNDLQSIELEKIWFPRLAKWLRAFTWIFNNGVPFFPDAETYKKAKVIIHFRKTKLGMWLTDSYMADKAKMLKKLLDKKAEHKNA